MTELNFDGLLKSQAYIGGAWVDTDQVATFDVTNPANNGAVTAWDGRNS